MLDELSSNGFVTGRDLSRRLGIELGWVNYYIKEFRRKGYLTVKSIPPKRNVAS